MNFLLNRDSPLRQAWTQARGVQQAGSPFGRSTYCFKYASLLAASRAVSRGDRAFAMSRLLGQHLNDLVQRPDRPQQGRMTESPIMPELLHLLQCQNQTLKIFQP